MRETFTTFRFRGASRDIIEKANTICADYHAQGFNLTLRQVYYQFVSRGWLPNNDRSYKRLGSIINDARLAGEMDWSYIQDRGRNVGGGAFGGFRDPGHFIKSVVNSYSEALWAGQEYRPEVWVEKEALVDVISQACGGYRVPYLACKGYVSQSTMYEAAKRFENRVDSGLTPIVIHLGDHDPSGIDMTRDIRERLALMAWGDIEVRRIALNMDQIEAYNPPPNPAKMTDSRGMNYVEEYGESSWELDALEPRVLVSLIEAEIESVLDRDLFEERYEAEQENEARLVRVADRWDEVLAHLGED